MKLLYCPDCHDVFKLDRDSRTCRCGNTFGNYLDDGLNAMYNSNGVPLGINNVTLAWALRHRPQEGLGERFEAFVIPVDCPTMKVLDA